MKKVISLLSLSLGLLVFCHVSIVAARPLSWYCVKVRDHKQPKADAEMRFVEQYDSYYVDFRHGDDSEEKVVYLTFDAGYENGNVAKIMDILKEKEATGAFFILGNLIERNPELVKRMAAEGHLVGNHTIKHKDITKYATAEELRKDIEALETLYYETTGAEMSKFFRPPEGRFNETSLRFLKELGYRTVFWSIAYADWDNANQMEESAAKAKILDNIHNGAIILLHPNSATNVKILGSVIDALRQQGYRFGSLNELVAK